METIISMTGVKKVFGHTTALQNLTFDVKRGEIFGFLGPNGAGKTTTIKLLTRQLKADRGEIWVFSRTVAEMNSHDDDRIGIQTDTSGVYGRLSVLENISLFASLRNIKKERAEAVLKDVGLYEDRSKLVKALSRGMKQRLVLAQAIVHQPELLFLDEPTASLDPGTSADIHELLLRLNKEGVTIFLTTHNMEEADKLCDRVAFLNEGEIREIGAPAEMKLKYAHDRIRATLADGSAIEDDRSAEGLMRIAEACAGKTLIQIHSLEPNLEKIFLKVTGRDLR